MIIKVEVEVIFIQVRKMNVQVRVMIRPGVVN